MTSAGAARWNGPTLTAVEDPAPVDEAWLQAVGMRVLVGRTVRRESQEELGRRSGVSRVTVGSIERADHPASVLAYARLAGALGLPLGELLDGYTLPASAGGFGVPR